MTSSNLQRGIQLFELGRYDEATNYLGQDMEPWAGRYYMALCYFQLDDYTKAKNLTDGLLFDQPDSDEIFFLQAQIAHAQDEEKDALSYVEQAIHINPYDPDYFGLKAAILLQLKKYDDGLKMADEGLNLDPNNTFCLNMRAQLLTKLDRAEEAGRTMEDILLDNPENAYSHANVGWIALENNDALKALTHFKEALQKDPNFEYARDGMSTALKSNNFLYRYYLKYSFWIGKKSSGSQWGFIIGIYLVYRFTYKLLVQNDLTFLAIPLIIAYLLFALGSWLMEPLSNMILSFDSYGTYLLSKNQKLSGYTFGALILLGILSISAFYTTDIAFFLPLSVAAMAALIPLPRGFLQSSKKSKKASFIAGGIILSIGVFGLLFVPNPTIVAMAAFVGMLIFTWVGNAFTD